MATDVVTTPEGGRPGLVSRLVTFLREVQAETKRVTWPSWIELRKATIAIIAFTLVLGVTIGWMDTILQYVLVTVVAKVF
ncbi:MAG TPA: preprotein translocase subunit SecE [Gemmatimonadales bacterium]|nr:preprotein translocase subunit SecE [Gemmatimonadales bacterium]HEX4633370.1 preprotein translocase subunit SecE [Gemmatimonadales bacterium]